MEHILSKCVADNVGIVWLEPSNVIDRISGKYYHQPVPKVYVVAYFGCKFTVNVFVVYCVLQDVAKYIA